MEECRNTVLRHVINIFVLTQPSFTRSFASMAQREESVQYLS